MLLAGVLLWVWKSHRYSRANTTATDEPAGLDSASINISAL